MKKKALIFGTLGASLLLAGGVFAAYTVTDNAGKMGIKISPTEIQDDAVGTVALSWGSNHSTTFTNISNLTIGTPQTKTVTVIAEAKNASNQDTTYTGKLDVELQDLSGKAAEARKLINYLHVDVKNGDTKIGDLGLVTRENQTSHENETVNENEASFNITTDKTGSVISFVVSIDASAQPYINSINTDQVYLAVDWSRSGTEDGVKHVYIPDNGWSNMWVYSYGSTGQNADFPGIELQRDSETGYFVADLLDAHTNFIFSTKTADVVTGRYPGDGEPGATRESLALNTAGNIYFDWSTHQFKSERPAVQYAFYLVGEATESWSALAVNGFVTSTADLPVGVDQQWEATLTIEAGKEYKFRSADESIWLGRSQVEAASGITLGGSDNFTVSSTDNTAYKVYIKHHTGESPYYDAYIAFVPAS